MKAVHPQSQAIGEFLEWLQTEKEVELMLYTKSHGYVPFSFTVERLLAEHLGIDLNAADDEKRAILDALRDAQPSDA